MIKALGNILKVVSIHSEEEILTLMRQRGAKWPILSENRNFSGTEPPLDLRPVCKFKFVCCGQGEKKPERSIFLG